MSKEPKHGTGLEQQVSGGRVDGDNRTVTVNELISLLVMLLLLVYLLPPVASHALSLALPPQFADLGLSDRDSRGDRRSKPKGKRTHYTNACTAVSTCAMYAPFLASPGGNCAVHVHQVYTLCTPGSVEC